MKRIIALALAAVGAVFAVVTPAAAGPSAPTTAQLEAALVRASDLGSGFTRFDLKRHDNGVAAGFHRGGPRGERVIVGLYDARTVGTPAQTAAAALEGAGGTRTSVKMPAPNIGREPARLLITYTDTKTGARLTADVIAWRQSTVTAFVLLVSESWAPDPVAYAEAQAKRLKAAGW